MFELRCIKFPNSNSESDSVDKEDEGPKAGPSTVEPKPALPQPPKAPIARNGLTTAAASKKAPAFKRPSVLPKVQPKKPTTSSQTKPSGKQIIDYYFSLVIVC